jgi:hypothetical protein
VINGRVAYPLHPSWSGWIWTYLLEQKLIDPLLSYGGVEGYKVSLGEIEVRLKAEILERVKNGKLTV